MTFPWVLFSMAASKWLELLHLISGLLKRLIWEDCAWVRGKERRETLPGGLLAEAVFFYNLASKVMQHPFQHAWWPVQPQPLIPNQEVRIRWDMWIFGKYSLTYEDSVWIKNFIILLFLLLLLALSLRLLLLLFFFFFLVSVKIYSERHIVARYGNSLMLGCIMWNCSAGDGRLLEFFSRCVSVFMHTGTFLSPYICLHLFVKPIMLDHNFQRFPEGCHYTQTQYNNNIIKAIILKRRNHC